MVLAYGEEETSKGTRNRNNSREKHNPFQPKRQDGNHAEIWPIHRQRDRQSGGCTEKSAGTGPADREKCHTPDTGM